MTGFSKSHRSKRGLARAITLVSLRDRPMTARSDSHSRAIPQGLWETKVYITLQKILPFFPVVIEIRWSTSARYFLYEPLSATQEDN
jgi:hypothetical protein